MALGYEGHVKVGNTYVLGTGASVPRNRNKLESASAYGGQISTPDDEIGIGLPRNYDWEIYDGSINCELTSSLFLNELKPWLFDRQAKKTMFFAPRGEAEQKFENSYFTSINISASDGAAVDASVGFVALERTTYDFGESYEDNKIGDNLLCPENEFPFQLNQSPNNSPVPYWNTRVTWDTHIPEFLSWSLEASQEVVKFFECNNNANPVEPKYLAVGPMSITFSGSYMAEYGVNAPLGFLGDDAAEVVLNIAGTLLTLKRLEATTESDDIQGAESMVPLNIEYAVYEITQ